jgi:polysaccharide pyruvyl transferase WcaK-like protein
MKVVLFDPSLKDNNGNPSNNLGDLIIHEFVEKAIVELFPSLSIYRISTHQLPSDRMKKNINKEDICFLGGSNILNSTTNIYNNWKYDDSFFQTVFSKKISVISLGTGWGEYQNEPNFYSKLFYSKRLDKNSIHSVRDNYTETQLKKISQLKVLNTCCPTTWYIDGISSNRKSHKKVKTCVFTLTDYDQDIVKDSDLLDKLLENFEELLFFPQGLGDIDYLKTLDVFNKNQQKIKIIDRSLNSFKTVLSQGNILYIGTRLHAGILALNFGVESLIISIDNRAREIAKDIHLPAIERNQISLISKWVCGEQVFTEPKIRIPIGNIDRWKKQFSK